jgi:dienelactone hydrolase
MKNPYLLVLTILITGTCSFGQAKTPQEFGFKHIVFNYKGNNVEILIKSKKGEENIPKPIFFFCQGSLPIPLIKYHEKDVYGVFPFNPDRLLVNYHLVIVSKPYIPVIADYKTLSSSFNYIDNSGKFPKEYSDRNLLTFYVPRNIAVLKHLQKQKWVKTTQLVVAGHSEGSTIASKMAADYKKITHLIYAGGNPMGRIMSLIEQGRQNETDTDSTRFGEDEINYWEAVVKNKTNMGDSQGDTHRATFEFSKPPIKYLEKLSIPVLVSYGTKDWSAPFNDYMRVDFIRQGKNNFTFQPYVGTEHNFFPLTNDNKPNYDIFNWDNVANDWLKWLKVKFQLLPPVN